MIVLKFGGTSVEDAAAIKRLAEIVGRQLEQRPLVVVSAMARATNRLLEIARLAANGETLEAMALVDSFTRRHETAAVALAPPAERNQLYDSIEVLIESLRENVEQISSQREIPPRLSDAIVANGELLSSMIVAAALRAAGINGVWVDVRPFMKTNADFNRAAVDFQQADPLLREAFESIIANGAVPVTQGFVGSDSEGRTTTIGRGGSDYSAAIIAAALDASEVQIWTDVDGIMTTDPRIVPEATQVKSISFGEAAELAYFGAKVLHPSTLQPAMAKEIAVSVRNSRRPEAPGTAIVRDQGRDQVVSEGLVKAIAFKRGITVINVASARMLMAHGFLARLFEIFERHKTAVDMVATSEVSVSMTLDDTRHLEHIIAELESLGDVQVEQGLALICLVGEGLRVTPGVAARIFSSIDRVNVSMISHGASAINVSFVVADRDVEEAVRALHTEFFSGNHKPDQ